MTLTEFLLARLAEDEDVAKRAAFGWGREWTAETDSAEDWATVHAHGKRDMVGCEDGDVTEHIARHDPAHVLADIEAKRRIVEHFTWDDLGDEVSDPEGVLAMLALPYASHPDYREEWRP